MTGKRKTLAQPDDADLAEAVRAAAQQIWQAGLGAFMKAQEEGGNAFARLVQEGNDLQKRAQRLAEDQVSEASETVVQAAHAAGQHAAGSWNKLEKVFEERVSRSLQNLDVPTRQDILTLTERIEALSRTIETLSRTKPPVRSTTGESKRAPARKTVAADKRRRAGNGDAK